MTTNPLRNQIADILAGFFHEPHGQLLSAADAIIDAHPEQAEAAQWSAFNRVLHWINTQDSKLISKGDLYGAVMEMRPQPAPDAVAEAWTSDWQWWAGTASDEMMTVGPCATRDQAIEEAIQDGFGEWQDTTQDPPVWRNTFAICECRQDPLRLADWIGAEWILERSDEALVDSDRVSSEFDDGPWFEASPDQEADLHRMLKAACDEWQRKHNLKFSCCTFSHSRNHETVTTDVLRALASQKETQ